jgi:hypothetical protein
MEMMPYSGLFQPLPILEGIWRIITMNFMEGSPRSGGRNAIWVLWIDSQNVYF